MSHFFSNFIETLFSQPNSQKNAEDLFTQIQQELPEKSEQDIMAIYCISGLLARIAYNDLQITLEESKKMEEELSHWSFTDSSMSQKIITLAGQKMKESAGIENHKYCAPLLDLLSEEQRYELLESLFRIAASDGSISPHEEEEIRQIANALSLPHKYFIAARAKIKYS